MNFEKYKFTKNGLDIKSFPTLGNGEFGSKSEASVTMQGNLRAMAEYQDKLYAQSREGLLVIIQAMDAAGKDGAVKNIFTIFNPAGVNVHSFKQPTQEELAHDFLWRTIKNLPERGKIAIFNRSYYEDVLIGRVHKLYKNQNMPERFFDGNVIKRRYQEINNLERYIYDNGITVLKFFLHISREEQNRRFLSRIDENEKNWKFSTSDVTERACWDDYMQAYEDAINGTATKHAPWFVIPADKKWYARTLISEIVKNTMKKMDPQYPQLPEENVALLQDYRKLLTTKP